MTVLELLEQDNIKGNWTTSTYGKKHESPCPGCGGTNRFHLWPEKMEGGMFWCRQCGKSGNATSYLMHFKGMDYQQALAITGLTSYGSLRSRKLIAKQEDYAQEHKEQSNIQWQRQSMVFLEWSIKCLHDDHYMTFRNWLMKERCLHEDTINNANLGWLPQDWYTDRKDWGLPEKLKDDGSESKLWIPAGLVIPCFHNGHLQRIRIRRHNAQEGERYYIVPGSSSIPMILGNGDTFVIVESELDALLLNQEAGDLVGVIALGSAQARPDDMISDMLQKSKKILVSLDNDHAGAKESWHWWMNRFPNAIRWPVILGKDPTEAHIKGLNLRDWVKVGVNLGKRPTPTIDLMPALMPKTEDQTDSSSIAGKLEALKPPSVIAFWMGALENKSGNTAKELVVCSPDQEPALIKLTDITPEVTNRLGDLLNGPAQKVFYDTKQAIHIFQSIGLEIRKPIYDVMIADRILSAGSGFRKTFYDVVTHYNLGGNAEENQTLSIIDEAKILLDLRNYTLAGLTNNNLTDTAGLEFDCIQVTAAMERNGIRVNREKLLEMMKRLLQESDTHKSILHKEMGGVNLNSVKQVKQELKAKGIWVMDTQQSTLMSLVDKYPFIANYIAYKKTNHSISLIGNLLSRINKSTGRLHSIYSQIGAPTGRFSCANPNLQGIPRDEEFRSCFIPDDGYKFVIADYSQIELRIVAEMSQDKKMIEAYQQGRDLHKLTASVVTGKSISHITKEERNAAKALNFGLIYAMGATKLMEYSANQYGVSITHDQATEFRKKFFNAYEGIAKWHQDIKTSFHYESRTLGNRRRTWECDDDSYDYGYGYGFITLAEKFNAPVQGTSADITKKALCIIDDRLMGTAIRIVGCIHDEIILEAPDIIAEMAADILKGAMIEAGEVYLKKVPVVVDVSIADNWSEK